MGYNGYNPTKMKETWVPMVPISLRGKLFSIFPTWPPTWKYDVAPPVEEAAFEVAAARWFYIQPVDGWLDILIF